MHGIIENCAKTCQSFLLFKYVETECSLNLISWQISKSNVVDDMVESNRILYEKDEKPDHCVVIKYVPYVGDSKRAMDEYTSEIFMHGLNTIVLHNTCEVQYILCVHCGLLKVRLKSPGLFARLKQQMVVPGYSRYV